MLSYTYTACLVMYSVRQKYLTIQQNSSEWNRWRGESVLERSSSETRSISVAMERWSVEHRAFAMEAYFKNNDCLDSVDISSALQYSSERVSLDAILLPLRISQEHAVRKETKDNGGFETTSGKKWQQFLPTCCNEWCRTSRNAWRNVLTKDATSQTLIQEVNVVIKMLGVKDNFSKKFA